MDQKKAELELAGEPWPVCECHGLPKLWKKRGNVRAGGVWFCRVHIRRMSNQWKWNNIEKVRSDDNRRAGLRKQDPAYYLKKIQYQTLHKAGRTLKQATNRAEEMYA